MTQFPAESTAAVFLTLGLRMIFRYCPRPFSADRSPVLSYDFVMSIVPHRGRSQKPDSGDSLPVSRIETMNEVLKSVKKILGMVDGLATASALLFELMERMGRIVRAKRDKS